MQNYVQIPVEEVQQPSQSLVNAEIEQRIKISGRVVAFFCFIQLVTAAMSLFGMGNIIGFCITAIFVSLGLTGVVKRRYRLVVAHFVYSVVVYILSLVGMVILVLYFDSVPWMVYAIVGLYIIIQAIGLKHSRLLIWALRQRSCGSAHACPRDSTAIQMESVAAPAPVATPIPAIAAVPAPTAQQWVQSSSAGTQSTAVSVGPSPTAPIMPMMPMMYPAMPQMQQMNGQFQFPMQPYAYIPYNPYVQQQTQPQPVQRQ